MTDSTIDQTVAGAVGAQLEIDSLTVLPGERTLLRELAKRVAELAGRPIEEEKKALWAAHNDLSSVRPLIFIDPENGWNEIITPDQLRCGHPLLRLWEMTLRKEIYWAEGMRDDRVIESYFNVPYVYQDTGWGLAETQIRPQEAGGSYVWDAPIKDYARDMPGLRYPEIIIDDRRTQRALEVAQDLLGDILQVRLKGVWWWSLGMTWDFIRLRGLENLMLDMYDHPEGVHALMAFLRDGMLHKLDFLEEQGLLYLNTEGSYVGSGGFGWTTQLPQPDHDPGHVRTIDMWGFAESQETVGVGPEMFAEFIFPYQRPLLERFGLNCYGCCEPVDSRWHIIREIPRLRRVSASPWADIETLSEWLGGDYILSIKPSPTPLAQPVMNEEAVRQELRRDLRTTRDNVVELIMKDNHTLGGNPRNATRWVEIAREEIAREQIAAL
ncbi:MAG: hypothetical protein JXA74_10870 [Anaerolineae bacterium]|nr:hypothetical protein [Anaerolineae bacterium]